MKIPERPDQCENLALPVVPPLVEGVIDDHVQHRKAFVVLCLPDSLGNCRCRTVRKVSGSLRGCKVIVVHCQLNEGPTHRPPEVGAHCGGEGVYGFAKSLTQASTAMVITRRLVGSRMDSAASTCDRSMMPRSWHSQALFSVPLRPSVRAKKRASISMLEQKCQWFGHSS